MGSKWDVLAWMPNPRSEGNYIDTLVYSGRWLLIAVIKAILAKRHSGCVKLVWR